MMGAAPQRQKICSEDHGLSKAGCTQLNVVNVTSWARPHTRTICGECKSPDREYWGLYNMVCEGTDEQVDVAEEILRLLGLTEQVRINAVI